MNAPDAGRMQSPARAAPRLVHALAALTLLPAAGAQEGPPAPSDAADFGFTVAASGLRFKVIAVPRATHAAIVAAVRVGAWHDPPGRTGLAHLLNTQIALTQEERPELERWSVKTTGPATVLATTCPRDAVAARVQELGRLLAGELRCDDDLMARARAQVLKRVDDYLHEIPGPLLFETARRAVLAGTPGGKQMFGVPEEIEGVRREAVMAWFAAGMRPEHTTLVVLGGVDTEAAEGLCRGIAAPGERTPPPAPAVHDSAGAIEVERRHPRVAAPFVTVAIKAPAPDSPQWLPFVIAMAVVNVRCHSTFGAYRGREAEAMFPFFWFDFRHGDAFALINRRGGSAEQGEIERDVDAVRGEVRALITRLRTVTPELGEVRQALLATVSALPLPPYGGQLEAMAQHSGLLMPRAELLAMADVLGWPPTLLEDLGKVPVLDVGKTLALALADANLSWFALLPGQ